MKRILLTALALLGTSVPALAQNEVGGGGVPPYVDYYGVIRRAPTLRDDLAVGQSVRFKFTHTRHIVAPDMQGPIDWNLVAYAQVSVESIANGTLVLRTDISNDWNSDEALVVRERLTWPGRVLQSTEYCRVDGTCVERAAEGDGRFFYQAPSYSVGFIGSVGSETYEPQSQANATLITPAGSFLTALTTYVAPSSPRTLKVWSTQQLPIFKAVKIFTSQDDEDNDDTTTYHIEYTLTVIDVRR